MEYSGFFAKETRLKQRFQGTGPFSARTVSAANFSNPSTKSHDSFTWYINNCVRDLHLGISIVLRRGQGPDKLERRCPSVVLDKKLASRCPCRVQTWARHARPIQGCQCVALDKQIASRCPCRVQTRAKTRQTDSKMFVCGAP